MAYPGEPLPSFVEESGGGDPVGTLNPTAIKLWIASELGRLRKAAGVRPEDAAARIGKAKTVIHHLETGRNLPAPADLEVLLNLYGVPERTPFFRELIKAAKRGKDWWVNFTDTVPEWFNIFLGLESAAARISRYDALWIPGPFQTREYAEAVFRARAEPMSEEDLIKAVDLRMARQERRAQAETPAYIWCVIDQNALVRQVGGRKVMSTVLDRLAFVVEQDPNVTVQILPHSAGAHAGAEGSFSVLDYPPEFEGHPGTAYVDTLPRGLYYEAADVTKYRRVFESLQVQAEKPEKTLELIGKAKKDMT